MRHPRFESVAGMGFLSSNNPQARDGSLCVLAGVHLLLSYRQHLSGRLE